MHTHSDSPLALKFDEALRPSNFLAQITNAAENQARRELAGCGNHAFGAALAGAKFVLESGTMQVVFESGIPKGAKLMRDLSGRILPKLIDGKTNRVLQTARAVSTTRKVASVTAGAALIVVEAAHMISGYDNAKRLKRVEQSVDALVHAHESELKSRLEAIYRYSKELLHRDMGNLNEEDRRELHRQCRDLIELRARWRDTFQHRMSGIKSAEPSRLKKIFQFWRKDDLKREAQHERATEAFDTIEFVQLMHFSLMLQMSLAGASGRMEQFQSLTLVDEIHSWQRLSGFAKKRAEEITGGNVPPEFQCFLDEVDSMNEFWSIGNAQSTAPMPLVADVRDCELKGRLKRKRAIAGSTIAKTKRGNAAKKASRVKR